MLQAHSIFWHYLWVAPNLMLALLGVVAWRRHLRRQVPMFVLFALVVPLCQLSVYAADVSPRISAENFWRLFLIALIVEGLLKVVLIAEIFAGVFGSYPSIAKLGRSMIRTVGAVLAMVAVLIAAYAQKDNNHWLIAGSHLLGQTIYVVESGLLLFIFLFASYFRLAWNPRSFGIALGLAISGCVHLATWALMANGGASAYSRNLLDFLNMATYHVSVLIWSYYLLVPQRKPATSAVALPEHNLELWNRELERLLQP